ncbi:MAG: hypothetical protein E7447_03120 [Ruminococcaceae bacterium]|nr:hypothetical protein [Oscillospiraceae bacterium]
MRTKKGVILLPDTGYIQVHAYAGNGYIPLQDVSIAVSASDGTVIALRLTDRSGRIDPISIPVPDRAESLTPNPTEIPFATVNLTARLRDYEQIFVDDVQIFPGVVTDQELALIPLSELPESRNKSETFLTSRQNL